MSPKRHVDNLAKGFVPLEMLLQGTEEISCMFPLTITSSHFELPLLEIC